MRRPGGGGDTPLGAVLEALAYAAVVEASEDDIVEEMGERDLRTPGGRPEVLVLGTGAYWGRWDLSSACDGWRQALRGVAAGIGDNIGIDLWFSLLEDELTQIQSVLE